VRKYSLRLWLVWILLVLLSFWQIQRTAIVTDVSSFLPGPANVEQRLMTGQLRDGLSTRIMLLSLRLPFTQPSAKPTDEQRAALVAASHAVREKLSAQARFAWVVNGDANAHQLDRERLFAARYLLSPNVNTELFTEPGLRRAFLLLEQELLSMRGPAIKSIAGQDPSLESLHLMEKAPMQTAALTANEIWFSPNGQAAILLMETQAKGDAIDEIRATIASAQAIADEQLKRWPQELAASRPVVEFAGSGYFNVKSHEAIGKDAERLSLLAVLFVAALLLWSLRSPRLLLLALVPVSSGTLAGFAVVGWVYGSIHGITIAFGVTLIGEAVDYAIYTFVQRDSRGRHAPEFWRQMALATLTSLIGFAAMYFSGFQGLQQLGLFSIAGLVVAAACARWLLPALLPHGNQDIRWERFAWLPHIAARARLLRWPMLFLTIISLVWLVSQQGRLWQDSLDALSSSSVEETRRDQALRDAIGVPDLRTLIAVHGPTLEIALQRAEALGLLLDGMVNEGLLTSFDSPAALLPSLQTQQRRLQALPEPLVLRESMRGALQGGRLKTQGFDAFLDAIEQTRKVGPLAQDYYKGSLLGRWLDAQIVRSQDGVHILLLAHPVKGAGSVAQILKNPLAHSKIQGVSLLDLQHDVEVLVADYRRQAMQAALAGAALIVVLLVVQLRRARAVLSMLATLGSTVLLTAAAVVLLKGQLTVFNLVALLLVAGVASNYTLFFSTLSAEPQERQRASLSVVLAAASTFIGFAMLATSSTPVLAMIGLTVAIGAVLGVVTSMVFSPNQPQQVQSGGL
jgi:predicted exporter